MEHPPLSDLLQEEPKDLTSDPAFLTAAALCESEARFREMIDALPAAIYTTDAEGRLTHFNPAAVEFSGRVPDLGTDQWCVSWKLYYPDGTPMPHDQCPMAIALKEGRTVRGEEAIAERPDGKRIWFIPYPTPLRDRDGGIIGGINMLMDITERRQAEEALRQSEGQFRAVFDQTTGGIAQTDLTGRFTLVNDRYCNILGRSREELLTLRMHDITHPDDVSANAEQFRALVHGGPSFVVEKRHLRPDGSVVWVHNDVAALRDSHDRVSHVVAAVTDITERKQTESMLAEHKHLLEKIATGCHLDECLTALCVAVPRLNPHTRACILLADEERKTFPRSITPDLAPTFAQALKDAPINDLCIGTCGEAVYRGEPVTCADIAHDERWSKLWRDLCVGCGVLAGHSTPIMGTDGSPIGSFFLCFDEARLPTDWELRLARFGAHVASIAIERDRVEKALRESESYTRQLLESSPDCVKVLDLGGRLISINPAGLKMLELHDDATLLNHEWTDLWASAERAAARQAIATATKGETAFFVGACSTSTGESKWWDVILSPVLDANRKPKQILAVSRDITDRKQAEEARARLAAIVASSDDAIISKNLQGIITSWNKGAEKIFGYAAAETIGRSIMMLIPPQRVDEEPNILASIRRGETVAHYETVRRRKDGTDIDISLTISPIRDETGNIIGASKIARDINDRKRAEEALRRLNDELEQRVTHRTRDLVQSQDRLRAMATELNLAEQRERKRLATELHDHLQQTLVLGRLVVGQGKRAAATVPACLDVMKKLDDIFTDSLTYTRTLVADLSPPVLRDHGLPAALKWLGEYMKKHEIAVTVTIPEKGDLKLPEDQAVLLFQSVRELLINSAKHAGTRHAEVRLERYDGQLRIEVSDQGVGFDLAAAAAAAAGTPTGGISSKFGLFSIQERMHALGGTFNVQSAPGQGTTATLVLPIQSSAENKVLSVELSGKNSALKSQDSALPGRSVLSTQDSALHQHAKIRVLLVDDHPMMRQGLRSIVTAYDHFHVVGEAGDGAEAVELAQRLDPDVVVMDINMPKMDGIEATQQIKANQSATVVIGLSVNQSADTEHKMKAAGASTYLTKESVADALCYAIEQAVSYKQHKAACPVEP